MTLTNETIYAARAKLVMKNSNYMMSWWHTIWKGRMIMCCVDNNSGKMMSTFLVTNLSSEDTRCLEQLIKEKRISLEL